VKTVMRHMGKVAAEVVPVAQLARLGLPALVALVFLAVLVLAVICWVLGSGKRSERVIRIILARAGDARCLPTSSPGQPRPTSRPRRPRVPGSVGD